MIDLSILLLFVCFCVDVAVQLKRYKELKEVARKQGATLDQKLEKLQWDVKADREKLDFDQRKKLEVEVRDECVYVCLR